MKKFRIISSIIALLLVITSIPFVVFAEDASNSINEFPVCTNDELGSVSAGYGGSQKIISAADATAAGAPQGEGYVLSITNDSNVGFNLDLRKSATLNYKISDVESMTFKVWVSSKIYEFRLRTKSGTSWQKQIKITPADGAWIEVELTDMSIFVDDGNGYFSPFTVGFRGNTDASAKVYVDSITLKLKAGVVPPTDGGGTEPEPEPDVPDTEAPVINWGEGIEVIRAAEGSVPLFNITATDNVDGEISTVLTWSEGAFDETGKLSKGEHTLTITATDRAGNSSERSVFVFVNSDRPTVGHVVQDS